MKKSILVIAIFGGILINKIKAQAFGDTISSLLAIDENQFIGKPLDSIINQLPSNYTSMKIIASAHRYKASKLRIEYPNDVWIELHVRQFAFMNPIDHNRVWDIILMRKENLYRTRVFKDTKCYRNCEVF